MTSPFALRCASIAVIGFAIASIGSDCGMSCPKGPLDRRFTVNDTQITGPRVVPLDLRYGAPVRAKITVRASRPIVVVLARGDAPEEMQAAYVERAAVAEHAGKAGPILDVYPLLRAGAGERVSAPVLVADTLGRYYHQLVVMPLDDTPYDLSLDVEESHSKYDTVDTNAGCQALPLGPPPSTFSALPPAEGVDAGSSDGGAR
jgi:hypothetical protein